MPVVVSGTNPVRMENGFFILFGLPGADLIGTPSASQFTLDNTFTQERYQFQGNGFSGFAQGFPTAGTVTSLVYSVNGAVHATITNASISVAAIIPAVATSDWTAFVDIVFAGADNITGSDAHFPTIGSGGDTLVGYGGNDVINAGAGDDTVHGDGAAPFYTGSLFGNDTLNGGANTDMLFGGAGNDNLDGGADNDFLDGEAGTDSMSGGDGNDNLTSLAGVDAIDGGAGDDLATIDRASSSLNFFIDLGALMSSTGATLADGTTVRNIETLNLTTGWAPTR